MRSLLISAVLTAVLLMIAGISPWASGFVVGLLVGCIGSFWSIRYLID